MDFKINQAVVFTKPVHHLGIALEPADLDQQTQSFFKKRGFKTIYSKKVTGVEMAEREVIRQHYLMYSQASYGDAAVTDDGKAKFESAFGKNWDAEVEAGRIVGNPQLMETKGITAQELYLLWNKRFAGRQTQKIQNGVIMAWIEELNSYGINAFYPAMESNFYNPGTCIGYHVVEFNPSQVSWKDFRKKILGSTDAGKADPGSFRGQLYAKYKVEFPGRDNFVHGSAGPFEAFIERITHEPDFNMETNPVGHYFAKRDITLETFKRWKSNQSITRLGDLFDQTEEKNTGEALAMLNAIRF